MELTHIASLSAPVLLLAVIGWPGQAPVPAPFSDKDDLNDALALSRDGKKLALGGGAWSVWDLATGKKERCAEIQGAHGMAFSPDGSLLAVGGNWNHFRMFDLRSGDVYWDLTKEGHLGVVNHLEFTPDGKFLLSSASDGMLRVWGVRHKAAQAIFCFTSNNPLLNTWKDYVKAWKTLSPDTHPGGAKAFAIIADIDADLVGFSLAPDGKLVAVPLGTPEVVLFELATGKVLRTLRTDQKGGTVSVCFSADGKLLALGGGLEGSGIEVWEVRGKRLTTLKSHKHSVLKLAFSPDGKTLLSGGTRDGARVWDLETGKQKYAYYQDKETCVVGVAFLPDGKTFVTLRHDQGAPAQFWDTATGKEVSPIKGRPPRR